MTLISNYQPLTTHEKALDHLNKDSILAQVIALNDNLPVLRPTDAPLTTLVRSVTGQLISTKAAEAVYNRLLALLGGTISAQGLLEYPAQDLRNVGLSWAKVRTLQAIATAEQTGDIDFEHLSRLLDEEIIKHLILLPGIGRWTAEMFLMFALARPDVFSISDLALRQGVARLYPEAKSAEVIAQWQPYRTLAARYLWADNTRCKRGGAPLTNPQEKVTI